MVKRIFFLFVICICSHQASARSVENLEIKDVGVNTRVQENPSEVDMCKDFRPTKEQIIKYFNTSRQLSEGESLLHEYYSPCVADGNVKFEGNLKGEWTLQSSGLAYLLTEKKKTIVFFLKNNKWNDPYACMYGLSDEPEPGC